MNDVLFARATRAIEASRALRAQRRAVADQLDDATREVRRGVMESAMLRSEIKALRDNREEPDLRHARRRNRSRRHQTCSTRRNGAHSTPLRCFGSPVVRRAVDGLERNAFAKSRTVNLLKCRNLRLRPKLPTLPGWAAPTGMNCGPAPTSRRGQFLPTKGLYESTMTAKRNRRKTEPNRSRSGWRHSPKPLASARAACRPARSATCCFSAPAERGDLEPDGLAERNPCTRDGEGDDAEHQALPRVPDRSGRACVWMYQSGPRNDEQAKREAASLVLVHRIELWRLDRRIAQFDDPPEVVRQ